MAVFYALESLIILNRITAIDTNSLISFIMSLYDSEKFKGQPNIDEIYIYDTYGALVALKILNKLDMIDKDAVINWILSMYVPEIGLFYTHYKPDGTKEDPLLQGTAFAIFALDLLGALDRINKIKTIEALYKYGYHAEDKLFYEFGLSPLRENYYIKALKILGGINETVAYRNALTLIQHYDLDTGLEIDGNIGGTRDIVETLYMLGYGDQVNVTKTAEVILSLQSHKYGTFYTDPSRDCLGELDTVRCALELIELANMTDRLDESFVVLEEPRYMGDWPNIEDNNENEGSEQNVFWPGLFVLIGVIDLMVISIAYVVNKRFFGENVRKTKRKTL